MQIVDPQRNICPCSDPGCLSSQANGALSGHWTRLPAETLFLSPPHIFPDSPARRPPAMPHAVPSPTVPKEARSRRTDRLRDFRPLNRHLSRQARAYLLVPRNPPAHVQCAARRRGSDRRSLTSSLQQRLQAFFLFSQIAC